MFDDSPNAKLTKMVNKTRKIATSKKKNGPRKSIERKNTEKSGFGRQTTAKNGLERQMTGKSTLQRKATGKASPVRKLTQKAVPVRVNTKAKTIVEKRDTVGSKSPTRTTQRQTTSNVLDLGESSNSSVSLKKHITSCENIVEEKNSMVEVSEEVESSWAEKEAGKSKEVPVLLRVANETKSKINLAIEDIKVLLAHAILVKVRIQQDQNI